MQLSEIEQDQYYIETVDHKDEVVYVVSVEDGSSRDGRSDWISVQNKKHGGQYLTIAARITREATIQEIQKFNEE